MNKYKSTHVSLDPATEVILQSIPEGYKSAVIRALLVAYKEFEPFHSKIAKHYTAMSGNLQLQEKFSEVKNAIG
jgi:hypothetical protein